MLKRQIVFAYNLGGEISYFDCHRCFLPRNHPFRLQRNAFRKDTVVRKGPSKRLSGYEIADILDKLVLTVDGDAYEGFGVERN